MAYPLLYKIDFEKSEIMNYNRRTAIAAKDMQCEQGNDRKGDHT